MLSLPSPDPINSKDSSQAQDPGHTRRRNRPLPDTDDVLHKIEGLNLLVLMGTISTARAGVIQRGLRMLLDELHKRTQAGASQVPLEELAQQCRQFPKLLETLADFLPDDVLQHLVAEVEGDDDEPT
jgi:hypothetical protein